MLNLPTKCYFLNILGHFYPFFFNTTYRMVAFAAVSFAEGITFGAWMRALAAPVANDGKDTITTAGNSWGGAARVGGVDIVGTAPDGNAGFIMSYRNMADMSMSAGDQANLWVKPIDMVMLSYGKYDNGTLMGGVCYGSWNWIRPNDAWIGGDEDLLMSKNGDTGLMAEITPMEGLYVQVLAPITNANIKAGDTYKKLRAGFAYEVPGLVKVKGQYIGKGAAKASDEEKAKLVTALANATAGGYDWKDADDDPSTAPTWTALDPDPKAIKAAAKALADADGNSNCTLEAEVDVLAVEGLFAGVGFQYNTIKDGKDYSPDSVKTKIALGASYQVMPELKVSANGAYFMYYGEKVDPRFQAGVGFDYDLGDGLAANADFRYVSPVKNDGKKVDDTDHMAFSVGVVKSVSSNGKLGVAFQGMTNSGDFATFEGKTKDGDAKFVWAIPVMFEVAF